MKLATLNLKLQINPKVLKSYIEAGGTGIMAIVCVSEVLFIIMQIMTNLWLSQWSEDVLTNDTQANRDQSTFRVSVYGYFGIGQGNQSENPYGYMYVSSIL